MYAQALAARRAGYHPTIICASKRAGTVTGDFGSMVRVRTPVRPVRNVVAVLHAPWVVRAIVRFLDGRPGPHVLHGLAGFAGSAVIASRALGRRGVEAIPIATAFTVATHEADAKRLSPVVRARLSTRIGGNAEALWARTAVSAYERRTFRACRTVVVNYESVRRLLEDAYGAGTMEIRRLTYAAPVAFHPELELDTAIEPAPLNALADPEAPLVLATSRHDGRKGLDVLLHALAALHDQGVPFRACLVGGGTLLEQHRRLAAELGLAEHVAVPGRVPDIEPYLGRADVLVLPSLEEGSGAVSILEALHAGVPVVASAVDGIPEDLTDGEDSLLVPPSDPAALAAALRRMLEDASLRERLGVAARRLHERRYSADAFSADLKALYAELGLRPSSA